MWYVSYVIVQKETLKQNIIEMYVEDVKPVREGLDELKKKCVENVQGDLEHSKVILLGIIKLDE